LSARRIFILAALLGMIYGCSMVGANPTPGGSSAHGMTGVVLQKGKGAQSTPHTLGALYSAIDAAPMGTCGASTRTPPVSSG